MAFTIEQSSGTGLQGAYDDIYYVLKDTTNTSEPKYRYLLRITIDSTVVGTFKQLPNSNDCAVFNIQDIVSNYVTQSDNVERLGRNRPDGTSSTTTIFATGGDSLKTVTIDVGYEYATTANDAPSETIESALQTTFKCINGVFRPDTGDNTATNTSSRFSLTSAGARLLSVVERINNRFNQYVHDEQFGVLAFLNGDDVGSDDCRYFHVSYYEPDGTALNTGYFSNEPTQGGIIPAAGLTDEQSFIYFGCFPKNLLNQSIDFNLRPIANSGWGYYDVQAASSTTLSGNEASAIYRFYNLCETRYNTDNLGNGDHFEGNYSLSFYNEFGGYDNLICDLASYVTQSVKRSSFYSRGGNSFEATDNYVVRPSEGGKTSAGNTTTTTVTLNTRALSSADINPLIQSLMNSPRVYLRTKDLQSPVSNDPAGVRCFVTDTSVNYKQGVNDKASNYTITVEISRRKRNIR